MRNKGFISLKASKGWPLQIFSRPCKMHGEPMDYAVFIYIVPWFREEVLLQVVAGGGRHLGVLHPLALRPREFGEPSRGSKKVFSACGHLL